MKENIILILVTIFGAGGFWELIRFEADKIQKKKSVEDKAILGLLHNEIYTLCEKYIKQGEISVEDYENLQYLYKPYSEMGGNGTAKKLMDCVNELPLIKENKKE